MSMRILLLTDGISPYVIGGMQKHSRLLAEYLARSGNQVTIYHCVDANMSIRDEDVRNSFSSAASKNITVRTFFYEDKGKLPGHYLRAQKILSKEYFNVMQKEVIIPDFVYTKGFVGHELLNKRIELPYACKVGVKFHGMNMFQKQANFRGELQKHLLRSPVKAIMQKSDVVFSYGGKITDIIEQTGISRKKILEIPAGIEADWIHSEITAKEDVRPMRFLFVGRYDRVKGLPELYKAIQDSQFQNYSWEFHFVGAIPIDKQLLGTRYVYHGAISNQNTLKEIYDASDILVNVSFSEGMPNVILEGMARGLVILATDVGATALLLDQNGILIENNDQAKILEALLRLMHLKNQELNQMKIHSLKKLEEFKWERIVVAHESQITKVLKESI
jgi:glycosyltransferase involved in cell wall biosynthesis